MEDVADGISVINKQVFAASLSTVNGGKNYITRSRRMGFKGVQENKKIYFDELLSGFDGQG